MRRGLIIPHVNLIVPMTNIANLAKTSSGDLLLIDHEATFHTSYTKARLSLAASSSQSHFFKGLSVFRKHTLERLCVLCLEDDPAGTLEELISEHDPISLLISSKLEPSDRAEFKERTTRVCRNTCHLLIDNHFQSHLDS